MIVLSYNIHSGRGMDGRRFVKRIADVIRSSGADIACLQEVEQRVGWRGSGDQPKRLAELLGMQAEYHRTLSLKLYDFGNLILSRYPITSSARYPLTSMGEQRGLLEVVVDTGRGPLSVFCTHWGLSAEERIVQSRETAAIVSASAFPKVVCGDLNDTPDSDSVRSLISQAGLRDLAAGSGAAEATYPSDNPRARIDYILSSPELTARRAFVVDSPASDHKAAGAEVEQGVSSVPRGNTVSAE